MDSDAPDRSRGIAKLVGGDSLNKISLVWQRLILLALAALVAGCASQSHRQTQRENLHSRAPTLNESLFGKPQQVPDFSEMISLTPGQQADFLDFSIPVLIRATNRISVYSSI